MSFCLIINIVHLNLNACGGSERLTIATMQALSQMTDIDIELTTFVRPDILQLSRTYGKDSISVFEKIKRIYIIKSLDEIKKKRTIA